MSNLKFKSVRKIRKEPIAVEAVQITIAIMQDILNNFSKYDWLYGGCSMEGQEYITIKTVNGNESDVKIGDWLMRSLQGELYTCTPNTFKQTYEIL